MGESRDGLSFFFVHRQIFRPDHPLWRGDEYSPREAFLWLCSAAAFKNRTVEWQGYPIRIHRGEVLVSLRTLGTTWAWTKSRVHRYLEKLKRERMITLRRYEPSQAIRLPMNFWPGVLGVVNYDGCQSATGPAPDAMLFSELESRDKPEDLIDAAFEKEFWPVVPKKVQKRGALRAFRTVVEKGRATVKQLVDAMTIYGRVMEEAETPMKYRLNPTTWLNTGSWNDDEETIRGKATRETGRSISSDEARAAASRAAHRQLADRDES